MIFVLVVLYRAFLKQRTQGKLEKQIERVIRVQKKQLLALNLKRGNEITEKDRKRTGVKYLYANTPRLQLGSLSK